MSWWGSWTGSPGDLLSVTLWKWGFRSLEGKNKKAGREDEEGQPPSAQQVLAMAQLPWKEAIGWVASPYWDKHTTLTQPSGHAFWTDDQILFLPCPTLSDMSAALQTRSPWGKPPLEVFLQWEFSLIPAVGQHHLDHTEHDRTWWWFRASAAAKRQVS